MCSYFLVTSHNSRQRILDSLKFCNDYVGYSMEEWVAIIQSSRNYCSRHGFRFRAVLIWRSARMLEYDDLEMFFTCWSKVWAELIVYPRLFSLSTMLMDQPATITDDRSIVFSQHCVPRRIASDLSGLSCRPFSLNHERTLFVISRIDSEAFRVSLRSNEMNSWVSSAYWWCLNPNPLKLDRRASNRERSNRLS